MKIMALEHARAGARRAHQAALLKEEARAVWNLAQAGVIREIYFRLDEPAAVIILEAPSVGNPQDILGRLPLVQAGLIEFDLIGLRPYPGYERLFAK
jgi:muconolactone delta-isomerase